MKYNFLLIPIFCCYSFFCTAQEQLGLRTGNYAGVNSIFLNPANNLTSPFQWDLNLAAGGLFVDNNFGGFLNAKLSDLSSSRGAEIFLATDFPSDQQFPSNAVVFDFDQPGKDKFASAIVNLTGPAFMLNFEQHSFGVFTNLRVAAGGQKIPGVLGYYDYKSVRPGEDYSVFGSGVAGMAWSELGLNYLYKAETNNGQIGIGFSVKYLQGYESFFLKNHNNLQITKLERDSLNFQNGAAIDFGFTTSSLDQEELNLQQNGTGFGFDFGVTYATEDYQDGYGLKLGFSILDIGKIKFDKHTEFHQIDIDESFFFNPRNLSSVTDYREGLEQLNEELFSETTATFSGTSYKIGLPTAISLQADVAIQENIYINATLLQRVPSGNVGVERGNFFAITPRYESRWISAFLPVSIYNWQHIKVGTAFRLAFLTFGTEDLGSIFGKKNLNSADFYVALKINPFRLRSDKARRGKGKEMKCYEF